MITLDVGIKFACRRGMGNNYITSRGLSYHHVMEEGGGAFLKELHDSHVGRACNDCNGSTICIYREQKTSTWQ